MYSTGCPSSNRSYFVLLPWSGGVCWVLPRPTSEIFAVPPRALEVAVPSAQWNGVTVCSLCLHFHKPGSCILSGWPLWLEWASIVTAIASQDSFRHILF